MHGFTRIFFQRLRPVRRGVVENCRTVEDAALHGDRAFLGADLTDAVEKAQVKLHLGVAQKLLGIFAVVFHPAVEFRALEEFLRPRTHFRVDLDGVDFPKAVRFARAGPSGTYAERAGSRSP